MSSEFSDPINREGLLAEIRRAVDAAGGERIGRKEFFEATKLSKTDLLRLFPSWNEALRAAGFDFDRYGERLDPERMLADWGRVARKLQRTPDYWVYQIHGKYMAETLSRRFGSWVNVGGAFKAFAADKPKWADVAALCPEFPAPDVRRARRARMRRSRVARGAHCRKCHSMTAGPGPRRVDRPICGAPLDFPAMRNAPTNEAGVVLLFGMLAERLGFCIEEARTAFPDCEAKRRVGPDDPSSSDGLRRDASRWQTVRIEFEYESRNFLKHGHAAEGCDLIVCWVHDWEECPHNLEVIELREVVGRVLNHEGGRRGKG